jgi:CorA-like Mg2+ transporter protein
LGSSGKSVACDAFPTHDNQGPRYAALVEDAQEYAEHCQFLLEELRAQLEEETNRNLHVLTMLSVIFLPATLIAGIWGMNVGGIPFSGSPNGFWVVGGLITAIFCLGRYLAFPVQVQVLLKPGTVSPGAGMAPLGHKAPWQHHHRLLPSQSGGRSVALFLLLPGAHAVGNAFVEIGRPDDRLYAREPHPLSYFVAHTGEGEDNASALQLFDVV